MTERTVTIKLGLEDSIGDRLLQIKKQRDALLSKSKISLNVDAGGLEQARRASVQAQAASASAIKDMNLLGSAISSKAVAPLAQYQQMLGSVMQAGKAVGPGVVSALRGVSAEFSRQRDLAAFWGVSGYMHGGVAALKSSMSSFLSTGGSGFTSWLQSATSNLAQYRTALTVAAAAMVGMAAAAGLSSKHSQNYIQSTLDSRLMARKLPDKEGAAKWIESAQGDDWSAGRDSRMGTFQTVLSKNKAIGQKAAQKATEDIEKYFFANQEMLQKKGIASAEQLASEISAPQLTGDSAAKFEDIFGLGFSNLTSTARLARLGTEAPDDKELAKAVQARPDEILSKRLTATTAAMGDAVIPVLNTVLGGFLKLSDVIGKIPGLGKAMGWGAVLMGAASAGLVMVSMVGSLIPGLVTVTGVLSKLAIVTRLAAAGQWVLNAAMSANPLGIAIIAIAGLVAGLYILEKKFGVVSKAWKMFSESSIGKGVFAAIADGKKAIEELLGTLGKAYKAGGVGGVLKVALEGIVTNSPMLKMIGFVVEFLRKIWANSATLNKLFSAGTVIWQRIADLFTWLLDSIKSGVQWIKDGLGITKAEKESQVKDIAEKEGLYQTESGKWGKIRKGEAQERPSDLSQLFQPATPSARLQKAIDDANNAPNSVFSKIGEVISGAMANVKTLFDPVLNPLSKAIGDLVTWLDSWFGSGDEVPVDEVDPTTGMGKQGDTTTSPGVPAGTGGITTPRQFQAPEAPAGFEAPATPTGFPQMARGGSIIGSGSIIGHGGEQVTPAAEVAIGEKTTLAKINEMFAGASGAGGQSVSISAPVTVHVTVDKVASDIDIDRLAARIGSEGADKLLFALRGKLNSGQLRDIGYLQG